MGKTQGNLAVATVGSYLPQTMDEAIKIIEGLKKQNVAVLGNGEVFVRRTPQGQVRSVKALVALEEANGELAIISNKAMTTAKGFYHANQITGLSIITPQNLTLPDGKVVINPYPVIDPESSTISKIWVKKLCLGYSPTGNLVITSATLLYDIKMYLIQDLMKKVTYNRGCGRMCMEQMLTPEEKDKGIFFKVEGPLGLWVDINQPDVLKAFDTFINKKNFAERNAQTICERVAMQKHPALAHIAYVNAEGPDKKRRAVVTLVGFVNDFSQRQLEEIAEQAERGEEIKINGQKTEVEVINIQGEATHEDMVVEVDDEEKLISETETNVEGASQGQLF